MQKTIKIITSLFLILLVILFIIYRSPNYNTENLIGNKLSQIKLESFDNNNYITNKNLQK